MGKLFPFILLFRLSVARIRLTKNLSLLQMNIRNTFVGSDDQCVRPERADTWVCPYPRNPKEPLIFDQPHFPRSRHRFLPAADAEFAVDVVDVGFDGADRHKKLVGDFLVGVTGGDEP